MVSYGMCEEHLPKWSTANCQGKKNATRLGIDGFIREQWLAHKMEGKIQHKEDSSIQRVWRCIW